MSAIVSRRSSSPTGFVRPCAPTILGRPPAGPKWQHEIKHDGYRIIARRDGEKVRIWTRRENEVGGQFVSIGEAMRALKVTSATIDGEAVLRRPDGHEDFHGIRSREGAAKAQLVAYDLLELDGEDLRRKPLEERREALRRLCNGRTIVFSEALDVEGPEMFRQACALDLEGIVSKKKGSTYQSGRSMNWIKTRNPLYRRESY